MASPAGIAVFLSCNTATTVAVSTCTAFIVAATGVYDAFSIAVATVYAADRAADATLAAVDAAAVAAAPEYRFVENAAAASSATAALGTGPSKCLGQARSWDRPFKCLGQARFEDRPFKMLGTGPLWGQALQNAWDRPPLGTGL